MTHHSAPTSPPPRRLRPGLLQRRAGTWVALTAASLTALALVCLDISDAARAYVGGESLWSKAQKSAVLALVQYAQDGDPAHWRRYEQALAVPLGDRRARLALDAPELDLAAVRDGFMAGGLHPDDIPGMIRLYRWGRALPPMARAIAIWAEGDARIAELHESALLLRAAVLAGDEPALRGALLQRVLAIDERLTPLEERFSATLGQATRDVRLASALVLTLGAVLLTGLTAAWLRRVRRAAETQDAALRASEQRRERALRGSQAGFFEWDRHSQSVECSPRLAELLGVDPAALPTRAAELETLQHPDDQPALRDALRRARTEGGPVDADLRLRHAGDGWRWFSLRAEFERDEGRELVSGSLTDIDARRRAEEALRQREALFSLLWETSPEAVLIVDSAHRIRLANPAAESLFGYAPGTLGGEPLARLQGAEAAAAHQAATGRYLASGQRGIDWSQVEVSGWRSDGSPVHLELSVSDFALDGEHLFVGFLRDVGRRRAAEQELARANEVLEARVEARTRELQQANEQLRELDRLKSEFVATMSHELRTPLNAVLGMTWLLLGEGSGPLNPEQRRKLEIVQGSGRHLLALINDVLDLSTLDAGQMRIADEPLDLAQLLREVGTQLEPVAQAKELDLRCETPAALPWRGDARRLRQVLLNLAGNAIKFTEQGWVRLCAEADAAGARLVVEDSGIGISPEDQARLFKPFQQVNSSLARSHEGTGLGLHLSQRLVQLMGGSITAHSEPGRGSRFCVTLPPPAP